MLAHLVNKSNKIPIIIYGPVDCIWTEHWYLSFCSAELFFSTIVPNIAEKIFNTKHSYWYIALLKSASNLDRTSHMGRRDPGISRDPGIFSKSRSRDFQKSDPRIFWDFQKPLNECIPRLSTTLIDHNRFF